MRQNNTGCYSQKVPIYRNDKEMSNMFDRLTAQKQTLWTHIAAKCIHIAQTWEKNVLTCDAQSE